MATFGIWHQLLRLHYLPYPEWTECSVQVVARLVLNSGFLNNNAPTNHLSITKGALEKLPKSSLQETKISNRLSAPGMPLRAATQRTPALQQKDADGTRASCARLDSFSNFSCCRGQPEMERQRAVKPSTRARGQPALRWSVFGQEVSRVSAVSHANWRLSSQEPMKLANGALPSSLPFGVHNVTGNGWSP